VFGTRGELLGLNIVGLRRRGLDNARVHQVNAAYKYIFTGPGVFAERVVRARTEFAAEPYVLEMLDFISTPSKHGVMTNLVRDSEA
jgi:UDP-N-acetylglucosamine acyltransferase